MHRLQSCQLSGMGADYRPKSGAIEPAYKQHNAGLRATLISKKNIRKSCEAGHSKRQPMQRSTRQRASGLQTSEHDAEAKPRLDDFREKIGSGAGPLRSVAGWLKVAAFVLPNFRSVSKYWNIPNWNKKNKKNY